LQQSEINALKRACAYSFSPNKLGYCGPEGSWHAFEEFLSAPNTEQNAVAAKEALQKFYALFPYLELIATANDLQPFDAKVIEAYWIGNELLNNVQYSEIQKTILSFQKFGLPRSIAEKKAAELPDALLPHHSMHVLYVNFISPKVKPIIENLGNCLIQWAEVKGEAKNGFKAKGIELFSENGELKLREKEKTVQNQFNLQLQPRDLISVHWQNAVEKISFDELKSLRKFTEGTIEAIKPQCQ